MNLAGMPNSINAYAITFSPTFSLMLSMNSLDHTFLLLFELFHLSIRAFSSSAVVVLSLRTSMRLRNSCLETSKSSCFGNEASSSPILSARTVSDCHCVLSDVVWITSSLIVIIILYHTLFIHQWCVIKE